ncbi:hypothetical protein U0L90_07245 [Flavobacteriaceae sp. LMIT009]
MKTLYNYMMIVIFSLSFVGLSAQSRDLQNYRLPDQRGINQFETKKDTTTTFDKVFVRVGASSALQLQAVDHENSGAVALKEIGTNFNLATANLDLDVVLFDGVRMHLRTYLSSRHHPEPYVKGGYIQFDKLDFISEGFLGDFMKHATIKIGHMENNYGDAHFRRSDNSSAIYNPFVGNLIMDGFTTEVGAELYYQNNGWLAMIGFTNGKLNQGVDNPDTGGASFIAKFGYDKQLNEDFRFRLTGSMYNTGAVRRSYLYSADRTGSRYYLVLEDEDASARSNFRSGRYNPSMNNQITAIMFNPFIKYGGLEFFGTIESTKGKADSEAEERTAKQFAGELIYRFGQNEKFFIGGRYNKVDSEDVSGDDIEISRTQFGAGWFMTKNILAKLEYVRQKHDGYSSSSIFHDGKFNGLMVETVISF